mmetsp:Transcript_3784/g.5657  ORF Transcript_3784/g.5657 Transcript_3784/m.5657 type:complete len:232 (-) Transcript_3784:2255-2950(-)
MGHFRHTNLKQEILLSQGQFIERGAYKRFSVSGDFISFWIDLDDRSRTVQFHICLFQTTTILNRVYFFSESVTTNNSAVNAKLGHEGDGALGCCKRRSSNILWSHDDWLGCGDRSIWISHLGPSNLTRLDHKLRFRAEKGRSPKAQIGHLSNFNRSNYIRKPMRNCRINRIFRDITFRSCIVYHFQLPLDTIGLGVLLIFRQRTPLNLHFVSCLPSASNYLSYSTHGLRVR